MKFDKVLIERVSGGYLVTFNWPLPSDAQRVVCTSIEEVLAQLHTWGGEGDGWLERAMVVKEAGV